MGARRIAGLSLRIREALPDYREATALAIVGLPADELRVPDRLGLRAAGAHRLVHAAAAAFGVEAGLRGNDAATRAARRAVVQLARRAGIRTGAIADAMQVGVSAVCRLSRRTVERNAMLTIVRHLALEDLVAQ